MTCGNNPCYCHDEKVEIPFMGDDSITNQTLPSQLASFVKEEDRVPILLALSLYTGQPRTDLAPQLIPTSVTPRTACWVYETTIVVAARGTCVPCQQGAKDLLDDKVSLLNKRINRFPGGLRF